MSNERKKPVTMKQVAKAYKKGVKLENKPIRVNYQTGTDRKMDALVEKRMGGKVAPGSSFVGTVDVVKRSVKSKQKPMSMTYGVSGNKGGTVYKKGKAKGL